MNSYKKKIKVCIDKAAVLLLNVIAFFAITSCGGFQDFSIEKKELGTSIFENTTLESNTSYLITHSLLIEPGVTLECEPGVSISFCDTCMIFCKGVIKAKGVKENRVVFESITGINKIIFENTNQRSFFQNVLFQNVSMVINQSNVFIDSSLFSSGRCDEDKRNTLSFISGSQSTITIQNSSFHGNGVKEGVGFSSSKCFIRNNVFDSIPDAIEFSNVSNGQILMNLINNSTDDGIDLNNCRNIIIENNSIKNSRDKGISIGNLKPCKDHERIKVNNNFIQGNEIAISIKGEAIVDISKCVISNNSYGVTTNKQKGDSSISFFSKVDSTFFYENENNYDPLTAAMFFSNCTSEQLILGRNNRVLNKEKVSLEVIKRVKNIEGVND